MAGTINHLKLFLSWSLATWYIEALTSPVIRLEPEQTAYVVGERVTVRCVANNPSTITGYTFYKDSVVTSNFTESNLLTLNIKSSDSGSYFCTYYSENGRKSLESNLIYLKVFGQPSAPSLFVTPQRSAFIKDQSAVLQCQLPEGPTSTVTGITLFQNQRLSTESNNVGVLNYSKLQIQNTGNYSCGYTVTLSGRTIESSRSKEEALIVIERPPIPRLRYAFSYQNHTQQVELACEVPNPSFSQIHGYRFYRNGIEVGSSNQVNLFTFNYTLIFDGCYSCRTFVTILGEEILSLRSFEQFLSVEGGTERQCQENMSRGTIFSTQGLLFYGSILAGKLLVLTAILVIFGVYLLVIQQRNQKSEAERERER